MEGSRYGRRDYAYLTDCLTFLTPCALRGLKNGSDPSVCKCGGPVWYIYVALLSFLLLSDALLRVLMQNITVSTYCILLHFESEKIPIRKWVPQTSGPLFGQRASTSGYTHSFSAPKESVRNVFLRYWMRGAHHCSRPPVSEMTYTASTGTLNSTIHTYIHTYI